MSGQATTTAARNIDLQAGGGFTYIRGDYGSSLKGFALYGDLDLTNHLGGEFVFHQANAHDNSKVYERTYELGPRYHLTYGRFKPYVKGMYGRGVFNYPHNVANLAFNLFAVGAGTDYALFERVNLRVDYEFQHWFGFPPNGLTPQLVTIGVAYHFPGRLQRGRHY